MPSPSNLNLSSEEQTKAVNLGRKLAIFVAALPATDQEKQDLVLFIQALSLDQMEKMSELVDKIYVESKTAKIDEKFKAALLAIKKEYEKKDEKTEQNFLKKLAELESELKK